MVAVERYNVITMCGRFSLIVNLDELLERFGITNEVDSYAPGFNIAPTQNVMTVVNEGENHIEYMRWGLIPSWAKDASIGNRMINARAETVAERPSFKSAFRRRRCLVVADGFYEWQNLGSGKRPMRIKLKSGEPFAFAGLWETWKPPEGETVKSCTIITTSANELMEPIHNRMPVILPKGVESLWLDSEIEDVDVLNSVLLPYPSDDLEAYEVSTLVNSASNNIPEVIEPVSRLI